MTYTLEIREEAEDEIYEALAGMNNSCLGWATGLPGNWMWFLRRLQVLRSIIKLTRSVFRQASVRSFPFVVYYEIDRNKIIVYSVFHTKRKPKKDF